MTDQVGGQSSLEYVDSPSFCLGPAEYTVTVLPGRTVMCALGEVLFPFPLRKYIGRQLAMSLALGLTVETYKVLAKTGGNARLSLPVLVRAEKLARDTSQRLLAIADQFKALREARPVPQRRRGMFEVAVREAGGKPRNAVGWHNGGKKLPPF